MNERIVKSRMSRRKFFKRAAKNMLFSDWLHHILAFVIVGACYIGINQFGTSLAVVVSRLLNDGQVAALFQSVYFVFSLAVMVPVFYGLVCFEIGAVNGKTELSDVFCAFKNTDELNRAYVLFSYTLFKCIICFLPAIFVWLYLVLFYEDGAFEHTPVFFGVDAARFALSALTVMLVYAGFVLTSKFFVGVYVAAVRKDLSIRESFFVADTCVHLSKSEVWHLSLSFLPLCLVSLFSVGILFVMYTLPYMFLTFTMVAKYIYETEMSKKTVSGIMYNEDVYRLEDESENNPKGSK